MAQHPSKGQQRGERAGIVAGVLHDLQHVLERESRVAVEDPAVSARLARDVRAIIDRIGDASMPCADPVRDSGPPSLSETPGAGSAVRHNGTGNGSRITVVLADHHTLFRDGVREMLTADPRLEVVGEVGHGQDTVAVCAERRPAVLLLDVEMPGPGADAVIRQVRRLCPEIRIVVLTVYDDAGTVRKLLDCGAAAFLVKTIPRQELIAAIHSVGRGSNTVLLSVSRQTADRLGSPAGRSSLLTERELEVLRLVEQAYTNIQIGARLHITQATVKRHLTNIYGKLHAVSRVDAVRKARAARLIGHGDDRLTGTPSPWSSRR